MNTKCSFFNFVSSILLSLALIFLRFWVFIYAYSPSVPPSMTPCYHCTIIKNTFYVYQLFLTIFNCK
ncbi:hypothetical protein HanIR_Chr07g0339271 [Helianthus annuus]|nr:hypothetical protein HanIR_Chr07g0339271 [Helianthus annuus]